MSQPPSSREFDRDNLYGDYQPQAPAQPARPPPSSLPDRPHGLPAPPSHPQGYENHQRGRSRSPQRGQGGGGQGGGQGFARQDRGGGGGWRDEQQWQGGGGGPRAGGVAAGGDWASSRDQEYRQGGGPSRDQSGWGAGAGTGDWRREEQDRGRGGGGGFPPQHQPYDDRRPPYQSAPPPAWDDGRQGGGYDQHQQNAYVDQRDPYGAQQQAYPAYAQEPQYHHQQPPPSNSSYDYDSSYPAPPPPTPKPKKDGPSEVSRHIIFLGLDPDMREADLFNFLLASGAKVESTTIIKDKITGLSKGFGFALFAHTTAASDFLLSHFPAVLIPFNDLPPRRVKIDFSASTNQPGHSTAKNGWGAAAVASSPVNDGMRDIASGGTGPVLLIRGVDVVTRWEEVLERLVSVEGGSGRGVKRVVGLRDRGTGGSWGFGFVEMRSAEFAKALLAHSHSPVENPSGFQISRSSRPVSVSYANASAFLPHPGGGPDIIPGSTKGLGGVAGPVKYWDAGASVVELYAKGWEAAEAADNELAAFLTEITPHFAPSSDPVAQPSTFSSAPVLSTIKPHLAQEPLVSIAIKVPNPGADKPMKSIFGAADHDEHEEEVANAAAAKAKGLIKIPPMSGSRKVASSISKWNTKQTELAADDSSLPQPPFSSSSSQAPPQASTSYRPTASTFQPTPPAAAPSIASGSEEFEYSDTTKTACLLCQRQLKSLELLRKHNLGSDLHKKNLADSSLRQVAKDRVLLAQRTQAAAAASEYRDRASERRTVFNQPVVPPSRSSHFAGPGPQTGFKGGRKFVEGPTAPPPPPPPGVAPGKDESNVGNKMLAKMGWKEGTGLGREGEGRVDPVMAASYAQGSGLGASRPTEAGKYQDQGGYGQRARDGARDRY